MSGSFSVSQLPGRQPPASWVTLLGYPALLTLFTYIPRYLPHINLVPRNSHMYTVEDQTSILHYAHCTSALGPASPYKVQCQVDITWPTSSHSRLGFDHHHSAGLRPTSTSRDRMAPSARDRLGPIYGCGYLRGPRCYIPQACARVRRHISQPSNMITHWYFHLSVGSPTPLSWGPSP